MRRGNKGLEETVRIIIFRETALTKEIEKTFLKNRFSIIESSTVKVRRVEI